MPLRTGRTAARRQLLLHVGIILQLPADFCVLLLERNHNGALYPVQRGSSLDPASFLSLEVHNPRPFIPSLYMFCHFYDSLCYLAAGEFLGAMWRS